jgi:3'-phosphoadenosine 5'-phosphosulfate sulfotransferase (PAPS reductase)/FAD synthetase
VKHVVGFSGGIDSQACALWVRQRHDPADVVLLFADTGWEDCLTYEFIRHYAANVFPVVFVTPQVGDDPAFTRKERAGCERAGAKAGDVLTMELLARIKGRWASSQARFCTTFLKLFPQKRWMAENLTGDYERYTGVRRDESRKRANTPDTEWDDFFDCQLNHPIAAWTKAECFDSVKAAGEAVNPLYSMGQSRVGCSPCHERSKDDIRQWAAYRPEEVVKVRAAEVRTGRTFFPPMVPGLVMNFIDDVIAWSQTVRGGRQRDLPMIEAAAEAGSCSSKYGLCE